MSECIAGARHLLLHCGKASKSDRILLIFDSASAPAARWVETVSEQLGMSLSKREVPVAPIHGTRPPRDVGEAMKGATLILCMSSKSMAHTPDRIEATRHGARFLSLPDYSEQLLSDPCIQTDYVTQAPIVRFLADRFTEGSTVKVEADSGTELHLKIQGRVGNACPGFVEAAGDLGSPPDIEANISPLETESEGILVCDGSIPCPEIGLLKVPVRLEVKRGKIVDIQSEAHEVTRVLLDLFKKYGDEKSRVLAELGIGLNPNARLTGLMLTDEGAIGTAHCGFGSNSTVGGVNDVPFHLDFVFKNPIIKVDGQLVYNKEKVAR